MILDAAKMFAARPWDGSPIGYPDPAVQVVDPRFKPYAIGNTAVERLATGCAGAKGRFGLAMDAICSLATFPITACCVGTSRRARRLFFASLPTMPMATRVTVRGGSITCEHLTRRVTRTEHNGTLRC